MKNRVTTLFNTQYPIIQAGMVWCSGWQLASAVSNAGGLGIIGSGSMYPEILLEHIKKCKAATDKPFAVNIPLLYPNVEDHLKSIFDENVPIVFTSAGNPKKYTNLLKERGIKVVHVVSSAKFALKAQDAGVDAIVAEGFEAGGHNGREETTTLCLLPMVKKVIEVPLIAAGGIASGAAMLACFALGAEAVQIGSRFVASEEASAHINFKNAVVEAKEGATMLALKKIVSVRLLKNKFYEELKALEDTGAPIGDLINHLGRGRAKKGMFEGELENGELEIGQIAGDINNILPAAKIVEQIWEEFLLAKQCMAVPITIKLLSNK